MSKTINVKKDKWCVTCKFWCGNAVIDYNAQTGTLKFKDTDKATCDYLKQNRMACMHCQNYQADYRYI